MFAILGEVEFEVIGSPESMMSSRRYDYAIHRVVQDRPRLQWLAPDLEVVRFELLLHRSFTNPAADMIVLVAAAEAHQPLPLVFGSGEFRGNFVISELSTLSRQLGANGDPIAISVRIELLESPLEAGGAPGVAGLLPIATAAASALSAAGSNTPNAPVLAGVSPLVANHQPAGATIAGLDPDDVPPGLIVRRGM